MSLVIKVLSMLLDVQSRIRLRAELMRDPIHEGYPLNGGILCS